MEKGAREEAYTGKKACDEADRREKWEDERSAEAIIEDIYAGRNSIKTPLNFD